MQIIGDAWPINLHELRGLEKHAENKEILTRLQRVKHVRMESLPLICTEKRTLVSLSSMLLRHTQYVSETSLPDSRLHRY